MLPDLPRTGTSPARSEAIAALPFSNLSKADFVQPTATRKPWLARLATTIALVIFLVAFVAHQGRVSFYAGPNGRVIALGLELSALVLASGICIIYRQYGIVLWSVVATAYAASQVYWFSAAWGRDANLNAISVYIGLFSSVVFVAALINLERKTLINALFLTALVYALFYLALSLGLGGLKAPTDPGAEKLFIAADLSIGRPARFAMMSSLMVFGLCLSFTRAFVAKKWLYLLTFGLFAAGFWLSYFRAVTAVSIFTLVTYTVLRNTKWVGVLCFLAFFVVSLVLIIGLSDQGFRPYDMFGHDSSATIRSLSYEATKYFVRDYWLFGVGLASSRDDTINLMATTTFYFSDIGAVGVFYTGGVVGLIIFVIISAISSLSGFFLQALGFERADADGLALAGCACTFLGVIAPDLWSGSSTVLSAIFIAAYYIYLKSRPARGAPPFRPWLEGGVRYPSFAPRVHAPGPQETPAPSQRELPSHPAGQERGHP